MITTQHPDLLELLAEHDHTDGCTFETGYVAALRRAAAYVQDYAGTIPRADVIRLQAPILAAIAIAECDACNAHGVVIDAKGRSVDHHPIGGAA